jgi:hypothetical protein
MLSVVLVAVSSFPIVEDGLPRATIAPLPADAPGEVRRAVVELQRVVQRMTGVPLAAAAADGKPVIHVGRDEFVDKAGLNLDELDEDGLVMHTVGDRDLILAGRYPHGSEFAVHRFLHKYGGVRWYFPRERGAAACRSKGRKPAAISKASR